MIPNFEDNGKLPAGVHWCSMADIEDKLSFSQKRLDLIDGLKKVVSSLQKAGCKNIYIDGSFCTNKSEPGDIDGCWDLTGVDPTKLAPELLVFDDGRKSQKDKFGCEFFPANSIAEPPNVLFIDFFQKDRDGDKKGILGIKI